MIELKREFKYMLKNQFFVSGINCKRNTNITITLWYNNCLYFSLWREQGKIWSFNVLFRNLLYIIFFIFTVVWNLVYNQRFNSFQFSCIFTFQSSGTSYYIKSKLVLALFVLIIILFSSGNSDCVNFLVSQLHKINSKFLIWSIR